jgi:hypothetical protein
VRDERGEEERVRLDTRRGAAVGVEESARLAWLLAVLAVDAIAECVESGKVAKAESWRTGEGRFSTPSFLLLVISGRRVEQYKALTYRRQTRAKVLRLFRCFPSFHFSLSFSLATKDSKGGKVQHQAFQLRPPRLPNTSYSNSISSTSVSRLANV